MSPLLIVIKKDDPHTLEVANPLWEGKISGFTHLAQEGEKTEVKSGEEFQVSAQVVLFLPKEI